MYTSQSSNAYLEEHWSALETTCTTGITDMGFNLREPNVVCVAYFS
jgi:hypothetical protein